MKKIFFLTLGLLSINLTYSQIAYYDALELKSDDGYDVSTKVFSIDIDTNNAQKVADIFAKYGFNPNIEFDDSLAIETLKDSLQIFIGDNNPFIDFSASGQSSDKNLLTPLDLAGGLSSLGGINVTNFADGLSQFLIDRATEELNVAFFNRFENFLNKNPEAGVLFPTTTNHLSNFSPYEYSVFITSLREAFYQDLHSLLDNVDDVFLLPKYSKLINDFPEILISINCIQLVVELEEGQHPVDIIKDFKELEAWSRINPKDKKYAVQNLHNGIKATYILSNSVRFSIDTLETNITKAKRDFIIEAKSCKSSNGDLSPGTTKSIAIDSLKTYVIKYGHDTIRVTKRLRPILDCDTIRYIEEYLTENEINYPMKAWVSPRQFKENIIGNDATFRIFLGLLYSQFEKDSVKFISKSGTNTMLVAKWMKDNKANVYLFQNLFMELLEKGKRIDEMIADIQAKEKPGREDYYQYINTSIDAIEFGFKLVNYTHLDIDADEYFVIARNANDLYRNVYMENYASAIMNATSIYQNTFSLIEAQTTSKEDTLRGKKNEKRTLLVFKKDGFKSIRDKYLERKNSNDSIKNVMDNVIPNILRYGTFIANVADSKNPEDVKVAIESAALPVGSSMVKKHYAHNVALNAYIGVYSRLESDNYIGDINQSWDSRFGVIAPVGISYTPLSLGRGGSISVFGSVIDVGAIAQFRLSSDGEIQDEITLSNIVSPGGYVVYGMAWDLPISVGLGGQYGPGLTSLTGEGNANLYAPSLRWNLFLAVDIPVLNIYKGKQRKRDNYNHKK